MTINSNTPHLKSPKNQNRRAALGRPAIKLMGEGLQLVYWGGGGASTSLGTSTSQNCYDTDSKPTGAESTLNRRCFGIMLKSHLHEYSFIETEKA